MSFYSPECQAEYDYYYGHPEPEPDCPPQDEDIIHEQESASILPSCKNDNS